MAATPLKPDLCIIGASPAGIRLAMRAREYDASVILIDRGEAGVEGPWTTAIPARALAAAAAKAQALRDAPAFGISGADPAPSFRAVHDHVAGVIASMTPATSTERLTALGIAVISGPAAFIDKRTLQAGDSQIRARRFVIATGARPLVPAIKGLTEVPFFTTRSIFTNTKKLTHLVVIGTGADALTLAQAYRRLGSEVTLISAGPVLAGFDPEGVEIVLGRLREEGLVVHDHVGHVEIVPRSQGIGINLTLPGDEELALDASHILVAIGDAPDLDSIDLDKAEIKRATDASYRLQLGPGLRTGNRRIFAIGDAAGASQPHAAMEQADLVLENVLLGIAGRYAEQMVPKVVTTDPGLGHVGLTEPEARKRYKTGYSVLRANYAENDLARATRQTHGMAKLIIDGKGGVIGASVTGSGAEDLLAFFAFSMAKGLNAADLGGFVAPHPSFAALVRELGELYLAQRGPTQWQKRRQALARLLP